MLCCFLFFCMVSSSFCSPVMSCVFDVLFFFKQKTAYEMRISDWSSDVCSSDLDRVARIADGVHRMAESDHDLLALHPRADVGFGLVRIVVAGDDLHRYFIGAAMLGAAQRANGAGDARIHVRAGTGNDPASEGTGIELEVGRAHV